MKKFAVSLKLVIIISIALIIGGCPALLAPNYDKALVDGLTSINTNTMEFFASVSGGTKNVDFSERKDKYSSLIGGFDALAIQAKARPVPKNKVTDKVNELLDKRGVAILNDDEAPSSTAITKISETLEKMKSTDQKQGVTAHEVLAFKNQVTIYMDQALTYESFLER